jgi:hypothetical protein
MAFSFIASTYKLGGWGVSSVATDVSLDIAAGDLIIAYVRAGDHDTTCTITDGVSNTTTNEARNYNAYASLTVGYVLSASAHNDALFTATFGLAIDYPAIYVLQFRPTASSTVSTDQAVATGNGDWSTSLSTGNITTTGTDELLVAMMEFNGSSPSWSNQHIGGVDGTVVDVSAWYRILDATESGINASATASVSVSWCLSLLSFKATAAGGGLAGSITGVSVVAAFQPYIYRTMINDVVSGQSVVASTQPYIYHTLVNDVVAAQSNLPTVLPYVYHTLINNVVTGLSNIPTLLPYVYHTLVNSIVTGLSNVPTLLPYIYHTLVNSVVSGVSTLFGNLAIIGAQVYQNLMGVVDGVSVVTGNIYEYLFVNAIPSAVSALVGNLSILGSTIGSKLRIYMRIGGGKF